MKSRLFSALTMAAIMMFALTACSDDDTIENGGNGNGNNTNEGSSGSTTTDAVGSLKELLNLDISIDASSLSESETLPDEDDEFNENYWETDFDEQYTVNITFDDTSASFSGDTEAVSITTGENGSDVVVNSEVKGVHYVLTGSTSDGSFKIYSEKKFMLELAGVSITNPTGAAINNQGKRAFVVLTEGTSNSLTDGSVNSSGNYPDQEAYEDEDMKGTFFSESKLAFSGSGSLTVTSKGKNGIVSDDFILFRPGVQITVSSTSGHCIKSNDGLIVRGGVLNCTTSATASKGFKTDGMFLMEGGRATAITSGGGEYDSDDNDVNAACGLKADSVIVVSGGELYCKSSGKGGKGISTDQTLTVSGGTVKVVTTGSTYTYSSKLDSKSKGIKADGNIYVSGGTVWSKATGDSGSEGIETKGTYTQDGGTVAIYSYDDGLNSKSTMTINGGFLYGYATGNDGIDSNGILVVNGGIVVGCGASAPEEGIDAAENYSFIINGGTVLGIGGGGEAMSGSQQKASISGVSVNGGSYLTVSNSSSYVFALQVPCSYSGATLQVSSPTFVSGTSYTLAAATSSNVSGDDVFGFISSPSVSSSSSYGTFTTSTSTTGGMSGNMGGGSMPSGGGGPNNRR